MDRKQFIRMMGGAAGVLGLSSFQDLTNTFKEEDETMPALFVGHGSPMNAIEDNEFSARWRQMGTEITKPKAVVCVSAHWLTKGSQVTAMNNPKTIHDFGGFPKALFDAQYPAPGSPKLAIDIVDLVKSTNVHLDNEWGLDHGTWSVVKQMYPEANIPVLQFSIDYTKPAQYHFDLAKQLLALRKKGVLIIGSGNMVHNLGILDWQNPNSGFDWAIEMNEKFKSAIESGDNQALIYYEKFGSSAKLAIPSIDHYFPLLYIMALRENNDKLSFFNDKATMGSITMTSVKIG